MKKYELTNEIMAINDGACVLHRIRALRNIPDVHDIARGTVKAGDLGDGSNPKRFIAKR